LDATPAHPPRSGGRGERAGSVPTGNPILAKTPLLLLRYPGVLAAVAAAAAVLVVAAASGPLFVSAAGSAALQERIEDASRFSAGLRVVHSTALHDEGEPGAVAGEFSALSHALDDSVAPLPHLAPGIASIVGDEADLVAGRREAEARLLHRGGALEHVLTASGGGAAGGVWLAETTARSLGVGTGDSVTVATSAGRATAEIAGVYQDLSKGALDDFWRPLSNFIVSYDPLAPAPAPPMLAGRDLALELGEKTRMSGQFRWEYPLSQRPITMQGARALAVELLVLESALGEGTSALGGFSQDFYETLLPSVVASAEALAGAVSASVTTLAFGGIVVALVVMALAGVFAVRRRGVEMRLLVAKGAGPGLLGARAGAEALLPIVLGGVLGWCAAVVLVRALGPSDVIAAEALRSVSVQSAAAVVLGAVVLGVVAGATARAETAEGFGGVRGSVRRLPWELPVAALAAASLYEVASRRAVPADDVTGAPHVDVLLLLFPILFVAAGAGLAARALGRLLPHLRSRGSSLPPSLYLATRRLGAASRTVLAFVSASAIAIGVFSYATLLSSSLEATANAKAHIFTGSDVSVTLNRSASPAPRDLPFPATEVLRFSGEPLVPGEQEANVLAIDRETFADVAFWHRSLGAGSLDEVLTGLDEASGDALPVIAAGEPVGRAPVLDHSGSEVPMRVVRHLNVFPGMTPGRPLLVADVRALENAFHEAGASMEVATRSDRLWVRADKAQALDALRARNVSFAGAVSAEQVRAVPSFAVLSWILGFLQALGVAAGVVVLVGMVLYLGVRGRARVLAYALANRMGLRPSAHGISVAVELAGMLLVAYLIGATLGAVAARLVLARMDPLPETPPGGVFDVPLPLMLGVAAVLALAAVVGAGMVQRRTGRADVAEVLRASE
jgi:putative ABC transport system permease protein